MSEFYQWQFGLGPNLCCTFDGASLGLLGDWRAGVKADICRAAIKMSNIVVRLPDNFVFCVELISAAVDQVQEVDADNSGVRFQHGRVSDPATSLSDLVSSDIETSDTATKSAEISPGG